MAIKNSYYLHKEYLKITNEVFRRTEAGEDVDPTLLAADSLIYEMMRFIDAIECICGCPNCGEEYWCRDVGDYCPNCGINVPETEQLNWNIWSPHLSDGWAKTVWEGYNRRGDLPLMPEGTPLELLQMELRGYRKYLYKRVAQDHPRFEEIHRDYLEKIKNVRKKIKDIQELIF
jgi:hypothetical protein